MLLDLKKGIQLVLTGVQVNAELLECFGRVNVEQLYENNTDKLLEVLYIFPLTSEVQLLASQSTLMGRGVYVAYLKVSTPRRVNTKKLSKTKKLLPILKSKEAALTG
jgi:hypothetical protein